MIVCPSCNHENLEGSLICAGCGKLLADAEASISTKKLRDTLGRIETQPGWGTAHFGPDSELVLYIPSESETITLLPGDRLVLGRNDRSSQKAPDLDLTPYDAFNKGVSRLHAAITRENGDTLSIVDLGSVNHTYVNSEQLVPHKPRILRDGDEIRLGDLVLKVYFK